MTDEARVVVGRVVIDILPWPGMNGRKGESLLIQNLKVPGCVTFHLDIAIGSD